MTFLIKAPFLSVDTCLSNCWILSGEQPNLSSVTSPLEPEVQVNFMNQGTKQYMLLRTHRSSLAALPQVCNWIWSRRNIRNIPTGGCSTKQLACICRKSHERQRMAGGFLIKDDQIDMATKCNSLWKWPSESDRGDTKFRDSEADLQHQFIMWPFYGIQTEAHGSKIKKWFLLEAILYNENMWMLIEQKSPATEYSIWQHIGWIGKQKRCTQVQTPEELSLSPPPPAPWMLWQLTLA